MLTSARSFWSAAGAEWRLKLEEARRIVVRNAFSALRILAVRALPAELAIRIADRFTAYREEEMFIFPGAHDAIDALRALGIKLALVTNGGADPSAPRSSVLSSRIAFTTSRSRASTVLVSLKSAPTCTRWRRSASPRPIPG